MCLFTTIFCILGIETVKCASNFINVNLYVFFFNFCIIELQGTASNFIDVKLRVIYILLMFGKYGISISYISCSR